MKAKKGQILLLTLVTMAAGLIVISPLLHFLDSSSNQYLHEVTRTSAYYTTDAMMESILSDISSGVDVYDRNASAPYNLLNPPNGSGYLNSGYNVSVSINYSITQPLPTPQGSGDWIYLDPGITICNTSSCDTSHLLGSLGYGLTHNYSIYLVGGNQVQVNWTFGGNVCCSCGGSMWMLYPNGLTIPGTMVNNTSVNASLSLYFSWSVPASGASGNYIIKFMNNNSSCACGGSPTQQPAYSAAFSGAGETDHTWVRIGKQVSGQVYSYQDYMITAIATKNGRNIVSITATVRSSPGPLAWWKEQTVEIPSWQITYYY